MAMFESGMFELICVEQLSEVDAVVVELVDANDPLVDEEDVASIDGEVSDPVEVEADDVDVDDEDELDDPSSDEREFIT